MQDPAVKLAQMLKESRYTVALTGAGISTESGIPDFRSPGSGLWVKEDPADFDIRNFRMHPERFYATARKLLNTVLTAEPNFAHRFLSRLEQKGLLQTVITQNIDNLHQKAGSKRVLEVHGSLANSFCLECGQRFNLQDLQSRMGEGPVPYCHCGGVLKPGVIFFGEMLPVDFQAAQHEAMKAQLMLVVGSSLTVVPVAYLPRYPRRLAIVNREKTPYDDIAEITVPEQAGPFLARVEKQLSEGPF